MEHKNAFWLSLVLSMSLAGTAVSAYAAQQKDISPPPPQQAAQPAPPHLDPDQRDAQRRVTGPYRLTYTLTEMDGTKRVGSQRYAIVLDAGLDVPPAFLKLGSKIPLQTGEFQTSPPQTQFTYIDVGLNISASLRSFANGLELRTHIVQSAIDTQQPPPKDPVIRQTDFQSAVLLNENKPITIGNVDMPGTTHVLQIQVELSKLP
jgi:hypothetical protein